ncbi:MAG: hypothetical protein JEZ02_21775 [Desulfatibacillum sp.]|nr:hypothetical protein [Desulfatibacillum sp.]
MPFSPLKIFVRYLGRGTLVAFLSVAIAGMALAGSGSAETTPTTGDTIVMGPITINKINKHVSIKARTAIDQGVLEYLLVEDRGKAYESAFKVEASLPSKLNFSLLLLGIEPLDYNKVLFLASYEKGRETLLSEHKNSLVAISLFKDNKEVGLPRVVRDREENAGELLWVFTGSRFTHDGRYAGDISLSHIAIWPDDSAVINLFSTRGNPYRGDFGFVMNEKNPSLKKDQEYELVLTPYKQ